MTNPAFDNEDEKPLDPAMEKVRRKMIRFMGVNLGLLFVALMAVVGAIVYKSRTTVSVSQDASGLSVPAEGLVEGSILLPAGTRIVSQSLSGERVSILVEDTTGGQAIYIFDLPAKRIVGRFDVAVN